MEAAVVRVVALVALEGPRLQLDQGELMVKSVLLDPVDWVVVHL